jgi:NADP-dependent 3-hydroxy acid dehydrogenase YdfG
VTSGMGGGDGIGKAMEVSKEVAREIRKLGVRVLALKCDRRKQEDMDRVVSKCIREFNRVDILVNNSGRKGCTA